MIITNDDELYKAIGNDLKEVINSVMKAIFDELHKQIDENVYDVYDPVWYPRNYDVGGLYGMWERDDAKLTGNIVEAEIGENPGLLFLNVGGFIHGSKYWETDDIRDILVDIVTHLGDRTAGPMFGDGPWMDARDFWTPLVDQIKNGNFDQHIESGFDKQNIIYKKG